MRTEVLARKIKKRRMDLGIQQKDFGAHFDRSASHANQWEDGKIKIPHELFDQMAKILRVHPRFFVEEDYWPALDAMDSEVEVTNIFSEAEIASMSPAEVHWYQAMSQILRAVPEKDRDRVREMLKADALSLMSAMSPQKP